MKSWTVFLCSSVGVVALGACSAEDDDGGGDSSGTTKIYCQSEDMGAVIGCNEHTVPNAALDASREACTDEDGILVDACPTAGFIGKCTNAAAGLVMHFYVDGGDAEDAEEVCLVTGGVWSDP